MGSIGCLEKQKQQDKGRAILPLAWLSGFRLKFTELQKVWFVLLLLENIWSKEIRA